MLGLILHTFEMMKSRSQFEGRPMLCDDLYDRREEIDELDRLIAATDLMGYEQRAMLRTLRYEIMGRTLEQARMAADPVKAVAALEHAETLFYETDAAMPNWARQITRRSIPSDKGCEALLAEPLDEIKRFVAWQQPNDVTIEWVHRALKRCVDEDFGIYMTDLPEKADLIFGKPQGWMREGTLTQPQAQAEPPQPKGSAGSAQTEAKRRWWKRGG